MSLADIAEAIKRGDIHPDSLSVRTDPSRAIYHQVQLYEADLGGDDHLIWEGSLDDWTIHLFTAVALRSVG